jgi:hypothetical protein
MRPVNVWDREKHIISASNPVTLQSKLAFLVQGDACEQYGGVVEGRRNSGAGARQDWSQPDHFRKFPALTSVFPAQWPAALHIPVS